MITKDELLTLSKENRLRGFVFHHVFRKNSDGTPLRCRASGQLKTWKYRPEDWKLPVKYGLVKSFYLSPLNASYWEIPKNG